MKITQFNRTVTALLGLLGLFGIVVSCSKPESVDWDKLYKHYSAEDDSVKFEAVRLLEANLSKHHSAIIGLQNPSTSEVVYLHGSRKSIKATDNLGEMLRTGWIARQELINDLDLLTTERLIEEIDISYDAWIRSPWFRDTPKWVYLNYLLPYRVDTEYADPWRSELDNQIRIEAEKWCESQQLLYEADPKKFISDYITYFVRKEQENIYIYDDQTPSIRTFPSFTEMKYLKQGECYMGSAAATFYMRSAGLPTAIDIIPYWGSINGSHSLDVHWDPEDQLMVKEFPFEHSVCKIFRKTFQYEGLWTDSLAFLPEPDKFPIAFLKNDHLADVTSEHVPTHDVHFKVPTDMTSPVAYICVYSYGQWQPVFWGKIVNGKTIFKNMGANVFYRIAVPDNNGRLSFISTMFYLDAMGEQILPEVTNGLEQRVEVKRINHGQEAYVKKGREYALFVMDNQGDERFVEAKRCEQDSSLYFEQAPVSKYYILKEQSSQRNLSRFFSYEDGTQDWLFALDSTIFKQNFGWK